MQRVSLILEGGGMRGLYTCGVLDCLNDANIMFENVIGVSAGACHATSYLSNQRGRSCKINTEYISDKRYISFSGLFTRGSIFGMDFIFDEIPKRLLPYDYDAFYRSGTHLTAVTTDCKTGTAHYYSTDGRSPDEINRIVRASSSLPMMAPTVSIDGEKELDGGTADSIPIEYALQQGFTKNIVVLTQNSGYQKQPNKLWWTACLRYPTYPKLVSAIKHRHENYNHALRIVAEQEANGNAFVLRPSKPIEVSRTEKDVSKLKALYHNGYEDMKAALEDLKRFCADTQGIRFSQ